MDSNDEFKEIDMKNRTCYYFNDIIIVGHFDFDNILLNKSCIKIHGKVFWFMTFHTKL